MNLKPCPFCGGNPKIQEDSFMHGSYYDIQCQKCWAQSKGYPTEEMAIMAWNSRYDDKYKILNIPL